MSDTSFGPWTWWRWEVKDGGEWVWSSLCHVVIITSCHWVEVAGIRYEKKQNKIIIKAYNRPKWHIRHVVWAMDMVKVGDERWWWVSVVVIVSRHWAEVAGINEEERKKEKKTYDRPKQCIVWAWWWWVEQTGGVVGHQWVIVIIWWCVMPVTMVTHSDNSDDGGTQWWWWHLGPIIIWTCKY